MLLYIGQARVGSQKGWFDLYYYEGGASYSQLSGYIHTSFQKTAKIWWDPWQGGAGAIYSSIDGSGSGYPIAEVDNCSRVIKYVVTLGQRYSTYSLVDMRVHDINVVADLTRHDPTAPDPEEPQEYDGTPQGYKPCVAAITYVDSLMTLAEANTAIWWSGWWPVLHMRTVGTLDSGATYDYEMSIDLIGVVCLNHFIFETPEDDPLTENQKMTLAALGWQDFVRDAFPPEAVLCAAAAILMGVVDIFLMTVVVCPTPWQLAALYVIVSLFGAAMFAALYALQDAVLSGRMAPGSAFGWLLLAVVPALVVEGIGDVFLGKTFYAKYWQMRGTSWGYRGVWLIGLALYLAVLKWYLLAIVCAMLIHIYEMCIVYYGF